MGDIGLPELLIMLAIAIALFGPARIGGIGKSLGEASRSFRQTLRDRNGRTQAIKEQAAPPYPPEDQALLRKYPNASD